MSTKEMRLLAAEIANMRAEYAEMRSELRSLREEFQAHQVLTPTALAPPTMPTPTINLKDLRGTILEQVGLMVNSLFDAEESRLLPDPQLVLDETIASSTACRVAPIITAVAPITAAVAPITAAVVMPPVLHSGPRELAASRAARLPTAVDMRLAAAGVLDASGTTSTDVDVACLARSTEITVPVVPAAVSVAPGLIADTRTRRGRSRQRRNRQKLSAHPVVHQESTEDVVSSAGTTAVSARRSPPSAATQQRMRSPSSVAAVILTLKPEAIERGVTFCDVLTEARSRIDLDQFDIPGLRFRCTAAGARVLEVPGSNAASVAKADAFAKKMKEVLEKDANVSLSVKSAELRITGLDYSVRKEDIVTAIAHDGNCEVATITIGELRRDLLGLGIVCVRCPVTAAKKIESNGLLMVGQTSASVELLAARPLRCFRCLEPGHVRQQCTSQVDRSDKCFRCGAPGHKAAECGGVRGRR